MWVSINSSANSSRLALFSVEEKAVRKSVSAVCSWFPRTWLMVYWNLSSQRRNLRTWGGKLTGVQMFCSQGWHYWLVVGLDRRLWVPRSVGERLLAVAVHKLLVSMRIVSPGCNLRTSHTPRWWREPLFQFGHTSAQSQSSSVRHTPLASTLI